MGTRHLAESGSPFSPWRKHLEENSCTVIRRLRSVLLAFLPVGALAFVLTAPAASATPSASWRCIAGICLGHSRTALDYRYGIAQPGIPSRTLRVPGGHVWACFYRCTDSVTEDNFTYYG